MRVTELKTWIVGNPPPTEGGRYFIFVKLTTSNGIVGYGEVYAASFRPEVIVAGIEDLFEKHLLDADPFQVERFWHNAYSRGYSGRPDPTLVGVISGLEIALWDIIGKATGRPVYDLLGGKINERLRAYTYLYPNPDVEDAYNYSSDVYTKPDAAAEMALQYVEQGFTALKFDPAGAYTTIDPHMPTLEDIERSGQFVDRIREAVGTKADLLFGTHGQFSTAGAIRLAQRLEAARPLWFEEPTPPDMPEQMAEVARATSIPIATGERLTTKYEFARVLATKAASILQPALGRVGGILECKKVAALAEAHYAHLAPHLYAGPIEGAANVQIGACSPNFLILESIRDWGGFHAELLTKKMPFEDGHVIPPTEPGLGVELNEAVADAHPWTGDALHIEPVEV